MWILSLVSIWVFIGGCVLLERDNLFWENTTPLYKKLVYLFCMTGPIGLVLVPTVFVLITMVGKLFDSLFSLADRLDEWMENSK